MQQTGKLIVALFAGLAGFISGLSAASAQDLTTPSGYQFFVTPYLWLASVHATTLERAPEVNSDISSIHLLSHLDGAPFMGRSRRATGPSAFSRTPFTYR